MNHSGDKRVFGLYDGSRLIFRGNVSQMSAYTLMDRNNVFAYARLGKKFNGHFDIVEIKEEKRNEPEVPKKSKFERQMDSIIYHLKRYGNTVLPANRQREADRYLNELKARGIDVKCTVYKMMDTKYLTLDDTRKSHGKVYTDWIVSLKEA